MRTTTLPVPTALPPTILSYAVLWARYEEHLREGGKRQQDIRNSKTALNAFRRVHNFTEVSIVGDEFDGEFEQRLEVFLERQKRDRIKASTYQPRVSLLRNIQQFFKTISEAISESEAVPLPTDFMGRLNRRIQDLGLTPRQFEKRLLEGKKLAKSMLQSWAAGRTVPSLKSIPLVEEIERLLGVEAGDLTGCLPKYLRGKGPRPRALTAFGKRIREAMKTPYGVWTDSVEEEWRRFVTYKSAAIPKKNERRGRNSVWTSAPGADIPSASRTKEELRLFFGYCCLPAEHVNPLLRGRGMCREAMSLALLAEEEIVEGFVEFSKRRAGEKYNNGTLHYLASVKAVLHPVHGYLPQHPEIAQKFDDSLTAEAWRERCTNTFKRAATLQSEIEALKKAESEHFGKGREPMEPIQNILDLDRPLIPILKAVKDMIHDLPPELSSPVGRAGHFRDTLLVALMAANPLRLRQFSIMEFDKHLARQEDGSWWLQFKKGEFKNRRSIKGDYRVRVARDVWPLIERYRREFRPLLAGADVCNYVFRPHPNRARSKDSRKIKAFNSEPMTPVSIRNAVVDATYCYIPICPGFSPHGFRHIVATDIIKRDPKIGFFLASRALHDKLETVEEAYEHLKTHEFFEPYNDHFADRWEEAMGAAEAGGVVA